MTGSCRTEDSMKHSMSRKPSIIPIPPPLRHPQDHSINSLHPITNAITPQSMRTTFRRINRHKLRRTERRIKEQYRLPASPPWEGGKGAVGSPKFTLKLTHVFGNVALGWKAMHWSRQKEATWTSDRVAVARVMTKRVCADAKGGLTWKVSVPVARGSGAGRTVFWKLVGEGQRVLEAMVEALCAVLMIRVEPWWSKLLGQKSRSPGRGGTTSLGLRCACYGLSFGL